PAFMKREAEDSNRHFVYKPGHHEQGRERWKNRNRVQNEALELILRSLTKRKNPGQANQQHDEQRPISGELPSAPQFVLLVEEDVHGQGIRVIRARLRDTSSK